MVVRQVISNKGKNTPGIDGIVWKTDKEKHPLGIPAMKDYAMQALQLLGLEAVETLADTVSFGSGKYRSAQDTMGYGFSVLCRRDPPQWCWKSF